MGIFIGSNFHRWQFSGKGGVSGGNFLEGQFSRSFPHCTLFLTNVCFYLLLLSSTCLTLNIFKIIRTITAKVSVHIVPYRIMTRREKLCGIM